LDEINKTALGTPGFASRGNASAIQHDLHKLGLIFINCIMPWNNIFMLSDDKKVEVLDIFRKLEYIPENIIELILGLINYKFNNADESLNFYKLYLNSKTENSIIHKNNIDYRDVITFIKKSIIDNIDPYSKDIIATDSMAFFTNRYCFGFGILGVLYSLNRIDIGEKINRNIIDAIVRKFMIEFYRKPYDFSSGLYVGLSGIVVCLLELDYIDEAKVVAEKIIEKKATMYDLTYGLAGRIIAFLKLYKKTDNSIYLNLSEAYANEIMENAIVNNNHIYWLDEENNTYTGMTRGSSGIALVFLYLYKETGKIQYLEDGIKALESDLSNLKINELGSICFNSWPDGEEKEIYSPYIHNGIAGLGCVLIRYYVETKNKEYLEIINEIIKACDYTATLFCGYLRGMSGIITFLQDCIVYLNSQNARIILNNMCETLSLFKISKDNIHGYAGDDLYRISHDLFTGSSGVILALNRTIHLVKSKKNDFLILDEDYNFNNI